MPTQLQIDVAVTEPAPVLISLTGHPGYKVVRPGETEYVTIDANNSATVVEGSGEATITPLATPVHGSAAKGTLANADAAEVSASFTAADEVSGDFAARPGNRYALNLSGTFVGTVALEYSTDGGTTWTEQTTASAAGDTAFTAISTPAVYRAKAKAYTSGTIAAKLRVGSDATIALYKVVKGSADAQQSTATLTLGAAAATVRTAQGYYYTLTGA